MQSQVNVKYNVILIFSNVLLLMMSQDNKVKIKVEDNAYIREQSKLRKCFHFFYIFFFVKLAFYRFFFSGEISKLTNDLAIVCLISLSKID